MLCNDEPPGVFCDDVRGHVSVSVEAPVGLSLFMSVSRVIIFHLGVLLYVSVFRITLQKRLASRYIPSFCVVLPWLHNCFALVIAGMFRETLIEFSYFV